MTDTVLTPQQRAAKEESRRVEMLNEAQTTLNDQKKTRNRRLRGAAAFLMGGALAAGGFELSAQWMERRWDNVDPTRIAAVREDFRAVCDAHTQAHYAMPGIAAAATEGCMNDRAKTAIMKETPTQNIIFALTLGFLFSVPVATAGALWKGGGVAYTAWNIRQTKIAINHLNRTP